MDIKTFLEEDAKKDLLRLSTIGSVDDGKSTLIGRLLTDSKSIYEDQLASIKKYTRFNENQEEEIAFLLDGLKAEREQGITIDVAYRYFSTPKRRFIIADTPGHEQYTRNMVTGASTSNLSIILIDAKNGLSIQTKRHSFIASLIKVPHLIVAINKMDLVDFSEEVFNKIKTEYQDFAKKLSILDIRFIPISAKLGDNVITRSLNMPWYKDNTVLELLENIYIGSDYNLVDLRFPVQYVLRPNQNFRGYAGQIASGVLRKGEEILILPSGEKTFVKSIKTFDGDLDEAYPLSSVCIETTDELDISRGDFLVRPGNKPIITDNIGAMLVWFDPKPMDFDKKYFLKHTTKTVQAKINQLLYQVDANTLHRKTTNEFKMNDIGRVEILLSSKLFWDPYSINRLTGSFILIDPITNSTVAAGVISDRRNKLRFKDEKTYENNSKNIFEEASRIVKSERVLKYNQNPVTLWITGLSGSGKSTIAKELEKELFLNDKLVYLLDGDNIRLGINKDLGFSIDDRNENIRRIAEIACLFNNAGIIVIASFISPTKQQRSLAREIIGKENFIEIFLDVPLEVCEKRDPKGLYKKARLNKINEFTGISSPYEIPENPHMVLKTHENSLSKCVDKIQIYLKSLYSK